ncbi:uncharacterized protein METZ01_LOCUS356420, partial [marine metagenome]
IRRLRHRHSLGAAQPTSSRTGKTFPA